MVPKFTGTKCSPHPFGLAAERQRRLARDGTAALRRLELLKLQRGRRQSPYEPLAAEYTCGGKDHRTRLAPKLRGVNLGGWLVLEPWVTPSLFYQFEGKPPPQTAMDHYTFCSILGPREGNRQLREHWRKWVTEDDLRALVDQGINTLRIPVGDWMWQPYSPYTGSAQASPREGVRNPSCLPCLCRCTAGALDELQRLLRTCGRLGLRVLIDMHGTAFNPPTPPLCCSRLLAFTASRPPSCAQAFVAHKTASTTLAMLPT